jgi:hypothetical protein
MTDNIIVLKIERMEKKKKEEIENKLEKRGLFGLVIDWRL